MYSVTTLTTSASPPLERRWTVRYVAPTSGAPSVNRSTDTRSPPQAFGFVSSTSAAVTASGDAGMTMVACTRTRRNHGGVRIKNQPMASARRPSPTSGRVDAIARMISESTAASMATRTSAVIVARRSSTVHDFTGGDGAVASTAPRSTGARPRPRSDSAAYAAATSAIPTMPIQSQGNGSFAPFIATVPLKEPSDSPSPLAVRSPQAWATAVVVTRV